MYNTINHFAESSFKSKALAEFFTSRAHTAEQLLAVLYDAVDNDSSYEDFLTSVEQTYKFSRNACIIVDDDGVLLKDVIMYIHSVTRDPITMIIDWDGVEVPSINNGYIAVSRIVDKLANLIKEGYVAAAGFTVISQEGTIADFRDILSERISNAYQDVSGQLSYWASMIRSKLDQDAIVEKVLDDMTPELDDEDHSVPPTFYSTPYAGLASACPLELAGLDLSLFGLVPSIVGRGFEAYWAGNIWVWSKIIAGVKAASKKIASGFLPYEAVTFSGGKAGTFKYGAWVSEDTINFADIPRSDAKWEAIDNSIPVHVEETMALDLTFGQFLFTCSGNTDQMYIQTIFKPKVIIPTGRTILWGSKADGSVVYPPDPIKTLSSISNNQAYKSVKYASLMALAASRIAIQELQEVARPAGDLTLLNTDPENASAVDIAHLLGDDTIAVDFVQGKSLASAMTDMIHNFCLVIGSFIIEKTYYPVDYDFLPFTSSMVGWDEYSFDLTSEEDARARATRNATATLLVAAAVAVAIKYGPLLVKSINALYARSLSKSFGAMSKAASGAQLSIADIRSIRRASSRFSLLRPASLICPIELGFSTSGESEYARLYSLIAGVYP